MHKITTTNIKTHSMRLKRHLKDIVSTKSLLSWRLVVNRGISTFGDQPHRCTIPIVEIWRNSALLVKGLFTPSVSVDASVDVVKEYIDFNCNVSASTLALKIQCDFKLDEVEFEFSNWVQATATSKRLIRSRQPSFPLFVDTSKLVEGKKLPLIVLSEVHLWQGNQRWPAPEPSCGTQTLTWLYRIHNHMGFGPILKR